MAGFMQYLKDTQGELRHVAWPTRMQTIIYTVIVIALSLLVAAYLGFFDFLFTSGLRNVLDVMPEQFSPPAASNPIEVTNVATGTGAFIQGEAISIDPNVQ